MAPRVDLSMPQQKTLIAEVRARPMLYDAQHPHYNSYDVKARQWRKIAAIFSLPPSAAVSLKAKWKLFRDTYARYLRTQQEEGGARGKPYRWAHELTFMQPHLRSRQAEAGAEAAGAVGAAGEGEPVVERPAAATAAALGAGLRELDATELAFLAHARTLRSFSPLRQLRVRCAVAQLLAEHEEEHMRARGGTAAAAAGEGAGEGRTRGVKPEAVADEDEDYSVYFES